MIDPEQVAFAYTLGDGYGSQGLHANDVRDVARLLRMNGVPIVRDAKTDALTCDPRIVAFCNGMNPARARFTDARRGVKSR